MNLAELFLASGGTPIEFEGRTVHMAYELKTSSRQRLLIRFAHLAPTRPQAFRLKCQSGHLEIDDELLTDVVIWSDTAPEIVVAVPRPSGDEMTVRVWNAWRDAAGTMQAWIGNAGMLIREEPSGRTVLECSDGYGQPSFDDLVVELSFDEPDRV